jgi:RHS repeat-associated protein
MPGGVVAAWRYNAAGRPTERRITVDENVKALRTYRWHAEGRLATLSDGLQGRSTEYFHDARGRLAGAKQFDGSFQSRTFDGAGNLYRSHSQKDWLYGPGGRLLQAGANHYIYDADGQLTEKHTPQGTWRYKWNGAGLLTEVLRPEGTRVQLAYDALARRICKKVVGVDAQSQHPYEREVRFVWDACVPLHEVNMTGALTTWIFEPESFSPLAKEDVTGRYAVVTDHLGTPTEMYDELGQLAWRMQLDTFGVGKPDAALQSCPWRWPGQYEDEETGLYYNQLRYYDAYAGRYISQDPIGLLGGLNLYGYPTDPLEATDPWGLASCSANAKKLAENLIAAGTKRAAGTAAHHIVASGSKRAREARKLLRKFGIDINDAANGVFLRKNKKVVSSAQGAIHSTVHTKEYFTAVEEALEQAGNRQEATQILDDIRQSLLSGKFP